jgi:TatA/E family protein of Tat protein translocase
MFGLGMGELAILSGIGLMLFGSRLPETMKSLGRSFKEFRRGLAEE